VCIPHPYRADENGKQAFGDACRDPASEWSKSDGIWRYLRETSDEWEDLEARIESGPHYHIFGACEDFDPDAIPDGWVIKNVRSFSRFHRHDTDSYEDMIAAGFYLLSHAPVTTGRQSVTYFGELSPALFRPEQELTRAAIDGIDQEVKAAIGVADGDDGEIEGMECPRDGCGGEIVPIERAEDWLAKDDWIVSISAEQCRRLRGAYAMVELGDRPPPHIARDREALLDWLGCRVNDRPMPVPLGRPDPEPKQVGLTTVIPSD
jgi:hypothetical protein